MWNCPKCHRTFKRKNQQHSCTLITKESLFEKRPKELEKLFSIVEQKVSQLGSYRLETVKPEVIFFKTKSTFLGIKVKKDHLVVEFFLDHIENIPPVFKYLQTSKHRIVHEVVVDQEEDITKQLMDWIKHSYELVSGK